MSRSRLIPLQGDASTRRYYRFAGAYGSRILCRYPNRAELLKFIRANRLYRELGLPVPRLIQVDFKAGEIVQSDLGDLSLEWAVNKWPQRAGRFYEESVDFLAQLAPAEKQADYPLPQSLYKRAHFEMRFFLAHFVRPEEPGAGQRLRLEVSLRPELHRLLASWQKIPAVLCHRDYHRRNLMVRESGRGLALCIIDHQDSRRGPAGYDLASFLYDSYGDFSPAQRDALARRAGVDLDAPDFRAVALQRALKALGTFGYQIRVRKKRRYQDAIPRTLAHARAHLDALAAAGVRYPALADFLKIRT